MDGTLEMYSDAVGATEVRTVSRTLELWAVLVVHTPCCMVAYTAPPPIATFVRFLHTQQTNQSTSGFMLLTVWVAYIMSLPIAIQVLQQWKIDRHVAFLVCMVTSPLFTGSVSDGFLTPTPPPPPPHTHTHQQKKKEALAVLCQFMVYALYIHLFPINTKNCITLVYTHFCVYPLRTVSWHTLSVMVIQSIPHGKHHCHIL